MRILFISSRLPGRIDTGGDQWAATVVASLRRSGHHVGLIGYDMGGRSTGADCVAVPIGETRTGLAPARALGWGLAALASGHPYTVQKWRSHGFRRKLRATLARQHWDLAIVYGSPMSWTLEDLAGVALIHLSPEPAHILYGLAARAKTGPARLVYAREARLLAREERKLVERAVETWCISDVDADHFRRLGAGRVRSLTPLCRPEWAMTDRAAPPEHDVVMLGNWLWKPNAEALRSFIRQVVPLLPASWRIAVGGAAARSAMRVPHNVRLLGPVDDACAFLLSGRRIAVPSTSAVGFNLKLLDAIAAARPVVATDAALKLAGPVPGHVRGASDAAAFAVTLQGAPAPDLDEIGQWMAARRSALDRSVREGLAAIMAG